MTYGDYKLINEVFVDNFEEADLLLGPLDMGSKTNSTETHSELSIPVRTSNSSSVSSEEHSTADALIQTLDKFVSWNFTLKRLEIELFLGMNDPVRYLPIKGYKVSSLFIVCFLPP